MLTVDARFCDTAGNGVGRWRMYYRANSLREARWAARRLVPSCQVRVRDGATVVVSPRRCAEFVRDA